MNFGNEKFDIILLAGQSNAEGSGVGPAAEEYTFDGDVYHMFGSKKLENKKWVIDFPVSVRIEECDSRKKDDLAVAFAYEYKKCGMLEEGRKLLIIDTGLGATAFLSGHWVPSGDACKRMKYMLNCALDMNPENRVVALLWHQGETDATSHATLDGHYANLFGFFADVREQAKDSGLPIISAGFCNQWKSTHEDICAPVLDAIKKAVSEVGGAFVETEDLPSNDQDKCKEGDPIHFSRNSLHILGRRYFEAYKGIVENKI